MMIMYDTETGGEMTLGTSACAVGFAPTFLSRRSHHAARCKWCRCLCDDDRCDNCGGPQ